MATRLQVAAWTPAASSLRCAACSMVTTRGFSAPDPLESIDAPTWLVVRDVCSRVLELTKPAGLVPISARSWWRRGMRGSRTAGRPTTSACNARTSLSREPASALWSVLSATRHDRPADERGDRQLEKMRALEAT